MQSTCAPLSNTETRALLLGGNWTPLSSERVKRRKEKYGKEKEAQRRKRSTERESNPGISRGQAEQSGAQEERQVKSRTRKAPLASLSIAPRRFAGFCRVRAGRESGLGELFAFGALFVIQRFPGCAVVLIIAQIKPLGFDALERPARFARTFCAFVPAGKAAKFIR